MDDEIIYTATYHNKTYTFTDACAPLIFSYGIYHVIDKEGEEELLQYIRLITECYYNDINSTNLSELCDWVAENWKRAKKMEIDELLDTFYGY